MSFTSARRDVRIVAAAKSVSWLGDEVAMIALVLRMQSEGRGPAAVAALLMANLLPIVLLSGVVGRMVDRVDNRMLLVVSSALQAILCAGVAFVSAPAAVLALMALLGAGQAVNSATWQALLPSVVDRSDLPKAVGLVQACTTITGVVAPAVGGVLTGLCGARVPLLVDAASFVAVLVAGLAIRSRRVLTAPSSSTERPAGGLAIVRRDALLAPLFFMIGAFVLLASMVNVVSVFLVRAVLPCGHDLVRRDRCCLRDRHARRRAARASPRWPHPTGAGLRAGLRRTRDRPAGPRSRAVSHLAAALSIMAGIGNGVLNVTLGALVMSRAAATERGRVGALLNGVASGAQIVAFAAGGALAGVISPRTLFVAAGLLGLLAPVLLGRRVLRAAGTVQGADSVVMTPTPVAA